MNTSPGRALWVGASQPATSALEEAGLALVAVAVNGPDGLRLTRSVEPDVVLAETVMPGMDGLRFAERIASMPLNARPALLLMAPPGMALLGRERLKALNAEIVCKPLTAKGLRGAIDALRAQTPTLPPEKAARLEQLMDALGIPPHPGRDCLKQAVALAWQDRRKLHALGDILYPETGALCGKSAAQVERAIRHVIDAAWRTGDMTQQQKIFGDTIDARRGRPTCGEMIAQLADILRWEG